MIASSIDECRHKCMADPECMQYSYYKDELCKTHVHLRLGRAKPGVTSGWIWDRVVDFAQGMASCEGASWPTWSNEMYGIVYAVGIASLAV